jgi:hypothetical protein
MPAVNRSPRTATPSAIATAGLTNVMTVARDGPTSAMSAKNTRNAVAVQTRASATTDAAAFAGTDVGHDTAAAGAQASALITSDAVTTLTAGRSASRRDSSCGPAA